MLVGDKMSNDGSAISCTMRNINRKAFVFANLFVSDLPKICIKRKFFRLFMSHGILTSIKIIKDRYENTKSYGFSNFEFTDEAAYTVFRLNGYELEDKCAFCSLALKKKEQEVLVQYFF